jgi:hypothetical protein
MKCNGGFQLLGTELCIEMVNRMQTLAVPDIA